MRNEKVLLDIVTFSTTVVPAYKDVLKESDLIRNLESSRHASSRHFSTAVVLDHKDMSKNGDLIRLAETSSQMRLI
jgi:hypothetical protein